MSSSRMPLAIAATAALLVSIVVLAIGRHVFHVADDFCFLAESDGRGLFDFVAYWWNAWSGRWAAAAVRYVYYSMTGMSASPWLAPFLLVMIFCAAALLSVGLYGPTRNAVAGALLAATLLILGTGQPSDLLFWAPGGVDWTVGYLFVALFAWMGLAVVRDPRGGSPVIIAGACVSGVLATGFGEVQALVPAAFAVAVPLVVRSCRNIRFFAIAASTTAGLVAIAMAPGSGTRREVLDIEIGFTEWLANTLLNGSRVVLPTVLILAAVCAHPAIGAWVRTLAENARTRFPPEFVRLVAVMAIVYPYVTSAVLYWSLEAAGPSRARGLGVLLLIVAWPLIYGLFARAGEGPKTRGRRVRGYALSAIGLVVLLGINMPGYLEDIFGGRADGAFRQANAQDALLARAGVGDDVVLPAMTITPHALRIRGPSPDPDYWINACMAKAWGVDSVRFVETPPTDNEG